MDQAAKARWRNDIVVAMGDGVVAQAPDVIVSQGLGSCVAVILYERLLRLGGLAHVMLPSANTAEASRCPFHYADSAIPELLQELLARGAKRPHLSAKLVGGARMFADDTDTRAGIGVLNVRALHRVLRNEEIPLIREEVGGRHGRRLALDLVTGRVLVTAIGRPDQVI